MEGEHDDDNLTFIRLAAVTTNVVMRLMEAHKKQTEHSERKDAENDDDPKRDVEQPKQGSEYVEHRLRELREFELRASGKK